MLDQTLEVSPDFFCGSPYSSTAASNNIETVSAVLLAEQSEYTIILLYPSTAPVSQTSSE